MSYSSAIVGNYFLTKARNESRAFVPLQLLKIVYIAHGWHLAYFDEPLLDEPILVKEYGPWIRGLYLQIKKYGNGGITDSLPVGWFSKKLVKDRTTELLDSVYNSYAQFSGLQLSTLTHQADSPWAYFCDVPDKKAVIDQILPDANIKAFYKNKITEKLNQEKT